MADLGWCDWPLHLVAWAALRALGCAPRLLVQGEGGATWIARLVGAGCAVRRYFRPWSVGWWSEMVGVPCLSESSQDPIRSLLKNGEGEGISGRKREERRERERGERKKKKSCVFQVFETWIYTLLCFFEQNLVFAYFKPWFRYLISTTLKWTFEPIF